MEIIQWESAAELRRQGRAEQRQNWIDTPWGVSQSVETLVTGMLSVTTAGHGGIFVSAERLADMPQELRVGLPAIGGGMWFEEDEAAAFPFLLFFKERFWNEEDYDHLIYWIPRVIAGIRWMDAQPCFPEHMGWTREKRAQRLALADWAETRKAELVAWVQGEWGKVADFCKARMDAEEAARKHAV